MATRTRRTDVRKDAIDSSVIEQIKNKVIEEVGSGLQGPQGPTGPIGPQGPAGPQGPTGPAGTSPTPESVATALGTDSSFVTSVSTELSSYNSFAGERNMI